MKKLSVVSIVLGALLLMPALAQAQTTGQISGKVTDEAGSPIVGAEVEATANDTGIVRTTKTDQNGNYILGILPVGNWTLTITAVGLQPQVTSFRLGVNEKVPVNAVLLPGEVVLEDITVFSTATALEVAGTQDNIDYGEQVENLPLEDRRIQVVARLAAHVSDATQTGTALTIAGAPSYDTVMLLDGAEISDPFFGTATTVYLEDAIEEVQVLTTGISARYGRFQGGVVNAITKSGTNNYEVTVRFEFDKESWNSKTPFGEDQSDTLSEVYQGTAGGYVLKDRAWFFGGYREIPATSDARTTGFTNDSFTTSSTEDRWQLKLRGAPVANHLIDVSHLEFDATTNPWASRNLNPGHLAAVVGVRGDPRETNTYAYQGVLTDNLFLELQATEKEASIFAGGDPSLGSPFLDWNTFDVFNNYWWDADDLDLRNNETQSGNVTYSLATDKLGTHTFEFGVQIVESITGGENRQTPSTYNLIGFNADFTNDTPGADGEPLFNLRTGDAERWTALPLGGEQRLENTGIYVQDSFTKGDWRFDIGFRLDEYEGAGALERHNLNFDKLVPRFAAAFNATDVWQFTGSWGEYTSRFNDNYAQGAAQVGSAPSIDHTYTGPDMLGLTAAQADAVVRNDAFWQTIAGFSGPGIGNEYLADDINAPFAEELTLSVRRRLRNNAGTIVLSVVQRDYKDLLSQFQGGVCDFVPQFFTFSHQAESCPGANTTDILDALGNVAGEVDTTVWANDPRNTREYEGISLQVNLRPGRKWDVGGSITLSETQGNYEGEGENTPAGGGVLGTYNRSIPIANSAPFGFVDEDIEQRLRAYGTYRFDFGRGGNLALSGIYSNQSGTRWSKTAPVRPGDDPLYVSEPTSYTHFFDGRGSNRFSSWDRFDVAARYNFRVVGKVGTWFKVSVINALNADKLLEFRTTASAVTNAAGILEWVPSGTCGLNDQPSRDCSRFGQIEDETNYQRPREYFATFGLSFK